MVTLNSIRTININITELGRPITANQTSRNHRQQNAVNTKTWRLLAATKWQQQAHKHLNPGEQFQKVYVRATPHYPNKRSLPDTDACTPTVKAIIDAAVDAQLIPNDKADNITQLILNAPTIKPGAPGITVSITGATYDITN